MALTDKFKITGLYKITADSAVLNDVDKMIVDFVRNKRQRRFTIPWQDFGTEDELKDIIIPVIQNLPPEKKIKNLTKKWKGEYLI